MLIDKIGRLVKVVVRQVEQTTTMKTKRSLAVLAHSRMMEARLMLVAVVVLIVVEVAVAAVETQVEELVLQELSSAQLWCCSDLVVDLVVEVAQLSLVQLYCSYLVVVVVVVLAHS